MKLISTRELSLVFFLMFISFNLSSQIRFEKGYFIDNSSQRIECFIKNLDWKKNPIEIEYKLNELDKESVKGIDYVKEFGIYGEVKYTRANVEIDRSSKRLNNLSIDRNPTFEEELLLLRVLVEGKANLYQYQDFNLTRYFYKLDGDIEQLVFKKYNVSGKLSENNTFRLQLWNNLKCNKTDIAKIKSIDYNKEDLTDFFLEYNTCNSIQLETFETSEKMDLINLTIRPRLNSTSLSVRNLYSVSRNIDFANKTGFGLGLEFEYIFPFNKNKWSMFFEGSYQNYEDKGNADSTGFVAGPLSAEVDYRSFEFALGLRHSFFLSDNSKLFLDASYNLSLGNTTRLNYTTATDIVLEDFETQSNPNFGFSIGYKLKDKYLVGLKYFTDKHVLNFNRVYDSDYRVISFIVGYSIF